MRKRKIVNTKLNNTTYSQTEMQNTLSPANLKTLYDLLKDQKPHIDTYSSLPAKLLCADPAGVNELLNCDKTTSQTNVISIFRGIEVQQSSVVPDGEIYLTDRKGRLIQIFKYA